MTSTTLTLPAPVSLGRSVAHGEDGRRAEHDDQHDEHGRRDEHAAAGLQRRWDTVVEQGTDAGMATAEYAIAMIAAVGFAGLLVTVLSSGAVRSLLTGLVTSALSIG